MRASLAHLSRHSQVKSVNVLVGEEFTGAGGKHACRAHGMPVAVHSNAVLCVGC